MSSVLLQSPSELLPKSLKAQNAAAKLLMSWGSMASPILKMQAASQGIQPSTPSSRGHWLALVSPLPWSLSAWLTMEGGRMAWLWAPGTEAGAWCGTQQLWTLLFWSGPLGYKDSARQAGFAATKAEVAKCQKYHDLQSNYHFQPVAIETTGVYGKTTGVYGESTAPLLSGLLKKLVDVSGDPRERQWLHQHLSLAVARGNAASILACVQVWSNFICSFSSSCF